MDRSRNVARVSIREVDHVLPDTVNDASSYAQSAQNLSGDLSGAEAHLRAVLYVFADVALPVPLDQPFTYFAAGDAASSREDRVLD